MSDRNPYETTVPPRPKDEWVKEALCAQISDDSFFPEKGKNAVTAKSICAKCLVREECLEYALRNEERFGIWGGKTERERKMILDGSAATQERAKASQDAYLARLREELGSNELVAQQTGSTPRKVACAVNRHKRRVAEIQADTDTPEEKSAA